MRGVTEATVDTAKQVLRVELAGENRVGVEQIRDAIEQDGTKTVAATVEVRGEVARRDGKWMLTPPGSSMGYEVATGMRLEPQVYLIRGRIEKLRPATGPLVLQATEIKPAP
jgi:hypothetical protein